MRCIGAGLASFYELKFNRPGPLIAAVIRLKTNTAMRITAFLMVLAFPILAGCSRPNTTPVVQNGDSQQMANQSFSSFIGDFGNRSWVVLFVNADFDATKDAYSKATGSPIGAELSINTGEHSYPPLGAVIAMQDSNWTTVFHLVGQWDEFDAAAFAKSLGTRVLAYEAEDTSGSTQCTDIAADGTETRMQVSTDSESEGELMEEMDEYAAEMGIENAKPSSAKTISNYEDYFESQGIQLVNISFNDDWTGLIVDTGQADAVVRAVRVSDPE